MLCMRRERERSIEPAIELILINRLAPWETVVKKRCWEGARCCMLAWKERLLSVDEGDGVRCDTSLETGHVVCCVPS